MAIGDYIKYKTGLSQRALAAELGMNPNAIQRRFSGTGVMDVETLVKIADRFGLDLLDLMVESGLITTARAKSLRVGGSIRDVSNEDLMGEVLRRMTAVQTREQSVRATVPPTTPRGGTRCRIRTSWASSHGCRERCIRRRGTQIHGRGLRPGCKARRNLRQ